jgi:hypothetical protein
VSLVVAGVRPGEYSRTPIPPKRSAASCRGLGQCGLVAVIGAEIGSVDVLTAKGPDQAVELLLVVGDQRDVVALRTERAGRASPRPWPVPTMAMAMVDMRGTFRGWVAAWRFVARAG